MVVLKIVTDTILILGLFHIHFGIGNGDVEMRVQNIIQEILTKMEIKQNTTGDIDYYIPYQDFHIQNYNVPDLEVMTATGTGPTFIYYVEHDINYARIWRSYNNATINYAVILKSFVAVSACVI